MTITRIEPHHRAQLHGGPLHGCHARIYRNPNTPNDDPPTITLCIGAQLPHWQPAGHTTYTRHPDGTYHWTSDTP